MAQGTANPGKNLPAMMVIFWMLFGALCAGGGGLLMLKRVPKLARGFARLAGLLPRPRTGSEETSSRYYGTSQVEQISFLEFGSEVLSTGKRHIWGSWRHQDAYDGYMVPRYLKDLLLFRDVHECADPSLTLFVEKARASAHADLMAVMMKYAALATAQEREYSQGRLRFCELGSTMFGMIDEALALDRVVASQGARADYIRKGLYVGYELSHMQNRLARTLYPGVEFELYSEGCAADYIAHGASYDVFYSISISMMYALRSALDLAGLCRPARLSVLRRANLALYETEPVPLGTGKYGYNAGLTQFLEAVRQGNNVEVFFNPASTTVYPPAQGPGTASVGKKNRNRLPVLETSLAIGTASDVETFVRHFREVSAQVGGIRQADLPANADRWLPIEELLGRLKSAPMTGGPLSYNSL